MSVFPGRFVGSEANGVAGEGTISVSEHGIEVEARRPRFTLTSWVAGVVSVLGTVFLMFVTIDPLVGLLGKKNADDRIFAVLGILSLLAIFAAVRSLLLLVLPPVRYRASIAFPFITSVESTGQGIRLVTTSAELAGTSVFLTEDAMRLMDEMEAAHRGPQPGYRQGAAG